MSVHVKHFKGLTDVVLESCNQINVIIGKNNSGKSSLLHAIEMAGLAMARKNWSSFRLMLAVADLFSEAGPFEIELRFSDGFAVTLRSQGGSNPTFLPEPDERYRFATILIWPEGEAGLIRRRAMTPRNVVDLLEARQFGDINGMDILYALRYYGKRNERGLTSEDYETVIREIRAFFPELEDLRADRTDEDIATVTYEELGKQLDIIYAGGGLKHLLDILIKTFISRAKVVLLDEPDAGMHPHIQRRFFQLMRQLAERRGLQFFLSSHSPVFLTETEGVNLVRIISTSGHREVMSVAADAVHTLWGDMGIKPSDFLQNDIVVFVEGQTDAIFLDHVINTVYARDFQDVSVGVVQYGGKAADGIATGAFNVSNISPVRGFCLWTRDRDSPYGHTPEQNSRRFADALRQAGQKCHIWRKREIEFYFPEAVLRAAQSGNTACETAILAARNGTQSAKLKGLVPKCVVPAGHQLRRLLKANLTARSQLDREVVLLVERLLIPWARKVRGE